MYNFNYSASFYFYFLGCFRFWVSFFLVNDGDCNTYMADLPGFYFDKEKNRYFPIKGPIPDSSRSSSVAIAQETTPKSTRVCILFFYMYILKISFCEGGMSKNLIL